MYDAEGRGRGYVDGGPSFLSAFLECSGGHNRYMRPFGMYICQECSAWPTKLDCSLEDGVVAITICNLCVCACAQSQTPASMMFFVVPPLFWAALVSMEKFTEVYGDAVPKPESEQWGLESDLISLMDPEDRCDVWVTLACMHVLHTSPLHSHQKAVAVTTATCIDHLIV